MTSESTGFEVMEPEGFMQPKRYRFSYRCELCGHEYSRVCKAAPKRNPPCPSPSCSDKALLAQQAKEIENLRRMLESGTPPAQIGHKTVVKAIDETANIVMQDYNLTNLRDNVGPGESVAPKLPPAQQAQAENYFGGGGFTAKQIPSITGQQATHGISADQLNRLGKKAMAGGFRNMAVPPTVVRPKASQGESPLIRVGTERLK